MSCLFFFLLLYFCLFCLFCLFLLLYFCCCFNNYTIIFFSITSYLLLLLISLLVLIQVFFLPLSSLSPSSSIQYHLSIPSQLLLFHIPSINHSILIISKSCSSNIPSSIISSFTISVYSVSFLFYHIQVSLLLEVKLLSHCSYKYNVHVIGSNSYNIILLRFVKLIDEYLLLVLLLLFH